MKKWFFTFGKGALFQEYFVEVFAPSYLKAQETMYYYYRNTWAKQYNRDEWFQSFYTVAAEYHLKYLETLFYTEEVEEYINQHNELVKDYK